MWKGYEPALLEYIIKCLNECELRHISVDTISERTEKALDALAEKATLFFEWQHSDFEYPPWLTEEFASNHRAILLGKAQESLCITKDKCMIALHIKNVIDHPEMIKLAHKKLIKAIQQLEWYQQFGWSEKPAKRNEDGKWPFLWELKNG